MPETPHYLDTSTGEVIPVFSFNRERILAMIKAEPNRFVRIAPQTPAKELTIMKRFATTVANQELRAKLVSALDNQNPFRAFRQTLRDSKAEYQRWCQCRLEGLSESLRARLKEKGVLLEITPEDEEEC